LVSHLQPVFARSSITKTQNRATIPALLFTQNEQIQTKSERQTGKLSRAHSLFPLAQQISNCSFQNLFYIIKADKSNFSQVTQQNHDSI